MEDDRPSIAGVEITSDMAARIAKRCGPHDYRYESDQDFVERIIFYLACEIEQAAEARSKS
jgi:hypothetical protein